MLIIEGKSRKDEKIKEVLKDLDVKKTLFVDASDVNEVDRKILNSLPFVVTTKGSSGLRRTIGSFLSDTNFLKNFETIIFYADCHMDDVQYIQELENKKKIKCVVTVQNNRLKKLKVYEI